MPSTSARPSARLTRRTRERRVLRGERDAGIVGLHDQRDRAIDGDRDADADERQHERLGHKTRRPEPRPA